MARVEDLWVRKDKTRTPVYGKGMRYRAEWQPLGENKQRKSFATKAAAMAFLAEQVSGMNRGTYVTSRKKILLSDYAAAWEKNLLHQRPTSKEQIQGKLRLYIVPTLGRYALDAVSRADVQEAVGEWSESLAPSTVKLTYSYLAAMFKAAVLDGVIAKSPCIGINLPTVEGIAIVPLRTEVVQMLAERIYVPYRPAVVLCAATGFRSAELRGLTWDRVDFATNMITIDRQLISTESNRLEWGPPKTAKSRRSIHVGEQSIQLLKSLQGMQLGPGGLVFHAAGKPMTRKAASQVWRSVRGRVPGLGEVGTGWHQLRHYHASQLIAGGMSPVAVAHRLGHKDATETLKTYLHLWPDDDTRAAAITDGGVTLDFEVFAHDLPMVGSDGPD